MKSSAPCGLEAVYVTALEKLRTYVTECRHMVFFGGAGVSTESGIPDFRSADGLYNQKYDVPVETLLSHTYFLRHTASFFQFYREKMLFLDAAPNAAHCVLARWEREGKLSAVVTQNIDGLHQAAGSRCVYELHGSVLRNHCMRCGRSYPVSAIQECAGVPFCSCGGVIKPDVVLYEESLDEAVVTGAIQAISNADLLLVAGTSLTVYPAAGLLRYFDRRHGPLVLINRDATEMDGLADLVLHEKVGQALSAL